MTHLVFAVPPDALAAPGPFPSPPPPRDDEVLVAWSPPRTAHHPPAGWESILSPTEHARALRFLDARARCEFIVGRLLVRGLLGAWLDTPPPQVPLAIDAAGRPGISPLQPTPSPSPSPLPLDFSIAHGDGFVAVAFTRLARIGIDLESSTRLADAAAELAGTVLSPVEFREHAALPPLDREAAFARAWVAKEAVLKAWGTGLGLDPASIEIAAPHATTWHVRRPPGGPAQNWELADWSPHPTLVGALCRFQGPPPAPGPTSR